MPTENETVYYTIHCHVSQHNRSERCQKEKKKIERCRWGLTYGGILKCPDGFSEETSLSLCSLK